jgi:hypothetical protein
MQYIIAACLPICSFFDIDGERACEVCQNSPYCYGDNINILCDDIASAERWLAKYKERSIAANLYNAEEWENISTEIFKLYGDEICVYKGLNGGNIKMVKSVNKCDFKIGGRTARFNANFIKLLSYANN